MNSKLSFQVAQTKEDFALALPLVGLLNPAMSEKDYWRYLADMQSVGNYTLYLAYYQDDLIGVCGCWVATKFYCGKYLEIDNFIIDPKVQSKGYGTYFLKFIDQLAAKANCDTIMLDAYLENEKAHAFYKRNGYFARGYHFIKKM